MELTINVEALDKTASAVTSSTVRTALDDLQLLVLGNIEPLTLSFCDDAGVSPAWVTDVSTDLTVGIGIQEIDGLKTYSSTSAFTISGTTRLGALALNTTLLRNALVDLVGSKPQYLRLSQGPMTLEIRKTTSTGTPETLALLQVFVALKVLPATAIEDTDSYAATQVISGTEIDWSLANTFSKTLTANTTFTFTNTTDGHTILVALTNTASNYTVTWPSISWKDSQAPVQTVGAKTDLYTLTKIGAAIYGAVVQNF